MKNYLISLSWPDVAALCYTVALAGCVGILAVFAP